jgi:hypothetical protein
MNDEHVLAGVEAVDRTHLHAVRVFALDAILGDDVSHNSTYLPGIRPGAIEPTKTPRRPTAVTS